MGCARSDSTEIRFDIAVEPLPEEFEGIHWCSYIGKVSKKKIAMGLKLVKNAEDFRRYGETVATGIG